MYVRMYVCMYVCIHHVCMYVYICVYTCTYAHMLTFLGVVYYRVDKVVHICQSPAVALTRAHGCQGLPHTLQEITKSETCTLFVMVTVTRKG